MGRGGGNENKQLLSGADVERAGQLEGPDGADRLIDLCLLGPVHNDGRLLAVLLDEDRVPVVVVEAVAGLHRNPLDPLPCLKLKLDLVPGDHAHLHAK